MGPYLQEPSGVHRLDTYVRYCTNVARQEELSGLRLMGTIEEPLQLSWSRRGAPKPSTVLAEAVCQ